MFADQTQGILISIELGPVGSVLALEVDGASGQVVIFIGVLASVRDKLASAIGVVE